MGRLLLIVVLAACAREPADEPSPSATPTPVAMPPREDLTAIASFVAGNLFDRMYFGRASHLEVVAFAGADRLGLEVPSKAGWEDSPWPSHPMRLTIEEWSDRRCKIVAMSDTSILHPRIVEAWLTRDGEGWWLTQLKTGELPGL